LFSVPFKYAEQNGHQKFGMRGFGEIMGVGGAA